MTFYSDVAFRDAQDRTKYLSAQSQFLRTLEKCYYRHSPTSCGHVPEMEMDETFSKETKEPGGSVQDPGKVREVGDRVWEHLPSPNGGKMFDDGPRLGEKRPCEKVDKLVEGTKYHIQREGHAPKEKSTDYHCDRSEGLTWLLMDIAALRPLLMRGQNGILRTCTKTSPVHGHGSLCQPKDEPAALKVRHSPGKVRR